MIIFLCRCAKTPAPLKPPQFGKTSEHLAHIPPAFKGHILSGKDDKKGGILSEDVEGAYKTGSYTATADGFGGPVEVTVEIGSNGGITDVTIKGDKETPDIGGAAIPVLKQAILTNQTADVDGVSGATFTSDAVRTAAGAALAQAGGEEVAAGPKAADGNLFIPGTYTETGTGFGGEITVTTTVSENKIEDVQITGDHETENIGTFAVQMLGERILAAQSPNVDALTGATVTSNAILGAFKKTLTAAGADMSAFAPAEDKGKALKKYEDLTTDIVIIGRRRRYDGGYQRHTGGQRRNPCGDDALCRR